MSEKRMKLIRESLEKLSPSCVEIEDEGHLHIGHAGAKSGGHFKLNIVSESFKDKTTIPSSSFMAPIPTTIILFLALIVLFNGRFNSFFNAVRFSPKCL